MNEGVCPVCKKPTTDNPAYYAMGWHVVVCSRECQRKAHERLIQQEKLEQIAEDDRQLYSGPDT